MDCKKFYWYGPYMSKLALTPETKKYEKLQYHNYLHLQNKKIVKIELEKFLAEEAEMTEQLVYDVEEAHLMAREENYYRMGHCTYCGSADCGL